jgi:hypothetical protein
MRRWSEANEWHTDRTRVGIDRHVPPSDRNGVVVREVERALGRRLRPFEVEFVLLPVADERIVQVRDERYLVPERVYDGPSWPDWLRELVRWIG